MALLEEWQKIAYDQQADRGKLQKFWQRYFMLEKGVYEKLLTNPDEKVEGTVKELAEKYDLSIMDMTGFLDGINDSLVTPNPIDTMEEDTKVSLAFDKEKLYKNMVDAKADWLYELPQWDEIFDADTKRKLYLEQKKSGTVVVGKKVGRNDPCPCGSGKKYKFFHNNRYPFLCIKYFGKHLENISQKNSLHSRKKSIQQLLSKGQNKEETSSMTGSQREEYIW